MVQRRFQRLRSTVLALSALGTAAGAQEIKPVTKVAPVPQDIKVVTKVAPTPVVGWADLHAHPASHLAFGATSSGSGKLFHGTPGLGLTSSDLGTAIPPCDASHFWDDADIVRSSMRTAAREGLEGGYPHGRAGYPTFKDWPAARNVLHQAMYIQWVHRAYLGGQRLMVASVTDNQTLAVIWNRKQFDTAPKVDPNFDFDSAVRQIAFIKSLATANSSWMAVVTTPEQARTAIQSGKLALVLGVELDKLTTAQVRTLVQSHGVRSIIPIHLSDNTFGGTAAYSDLFNTNTHFLTGDFIHVQFDTSLRYRLSHPEYLRYLDHTEADDFLSGLAGFLTLGTIGVGALKPTPVDEATYTTLGYARGTGGHRNSKPLNEPEIKALMRLGLVIDVAHMSQVSQESTLRLAKAADYPVMNSHTGLRSGPAENERAMRTSDAQAMVRSGGILGIGTVGDNDVAALLDRHPAPRQESLVRLTGSSREWLTSSERPSVRALGMAYQYARVTVGTGKDGKRDNEGAWVVLVLTSGQRIELPLVPSLQGLADNSSTVQVHPLGRGVRLDEIRQVGVRHHTAEYFKDGQFRNHDNWDVKTLKVELLPDPITSWTRDTADWLEAIGGGNIALGTDFNGLEKQLPGHPSIQIKYPIDIVKRFAPTQRLSGDRVPTDLYEQKIGGVSMPFAEKGIAEYGLLPDFLQAVSQAPRGEGVVRALFRGAEDFIQLWEKASVAKDRVR